LFVLIVKFIKINI